MSTTARAERTRFTIYRQTGPLGHLWRRRRVRWPIYLLLAAILGAIGFWAVFARDLPSARSLLAYEPPLPSNVRDISGAPVQAFARERRVELRYDEYPEQLVQAFISAEDKTFFEHGGVDFPGLFGAVIDYASKLGSGQRAKGGSTITQQVAKNLLLGDEYSVTRKVKEGILAYKIENVLSKEQIMELYLNQIFLGRNAYGVQSAARAYFNKDVDALTLPEMAYLAVLPKAPSNYTPERFATRAIERRNYVLGEMLDNGFITPSQRFAAAAAPLGTITAGAGIGFANVGGYFMEEIRRTLVDEWGAGTEKGRNGIYSGGLWIRSSYDPVRQAAAEKALRDGMLRFDGGGRWRDPGKTIDVGPGWQQRLAIAEFGPGYPDWRTAVVLSKSGSDAILGFTDGTTGRMPSWAASMPKRSVGGRAFSFLRPGMLIAVKKEGDVYALRSIPEISGGFVAQEVRTGRVLAMQGGWDVRGQSFNRATQALRQPGSAFKPFVYSAALDNGMTPASIIVDGNFCVYQGRSLGNKCFENFGGAGGAGPQTMRWGLEQSRNLMTVRTANQTGMGKIVALADKVGIKPADVDYPKVLAISLGAGETTVSRLTNAYAILANNGRAVSPSIIDYVQDRHGKVILRADDRCKIMNGQCNARNWNGGAMPRPPLITKQLMDPVTAYQMVHILEGVVERGTATTLRDLKRPLFGKTGTTSGPKDVWFVGGSQDIVAGVYLGYDRPRDMGHSAQGGRIAAPIFKQFAHIAYKDMPVVPFTAPAGVRLVRIDRRSGRRVYGAFPGDDPQAAVIWEAFKPQSEPRRSIRRDEVSRRPVNAAEVLAIRRAAIARYRARRDSRRAEIERAEGESVEREGGIY